MGGWGSWLEGPGRVGELWDGGGTVNRPCRKKPTDFDLLFIFVVGCFGFFFLVLFFYFLPLYVYVGNL